MAKIFVNLKRFDVSRTLGGICTMDNPQEWIEWIMAESVEYGLGSLENTEVTYLLPEGLVLPAINKLENYSKERTATIKIGCQGNFREDVEQGKNFGAFTTNLPAAAAKNMGCTCTIIGHSEERKDKLGTLSSYDPEILTQPEKNSLAQNAVSELINQEVLCALKNGLKVLLCVGETAEEKGDGEFEEQKRSIEKVLRSQLKIGLKGTQTFNQEEKIIIGYEPVWAIGPGKTPPGAEYIAFVSSYIKLYCKEEFGFDPLVVYGGGLKEENAEMISNIDTIGGGLVALTRFSGDIGFYPDELTKIIDKYIK